MWGRVRESRCNMLDGLRMKRVSLYFNKGVLLLVSLVMQMEAFAQRGRAIPQDWGGGGYSYSHGSGDSFYYIIFAIILVFYIVFKIQSYNEKRKDAAQSNTKGNTSSSVGCECNSATNNAIGNEDESLRNISRFATDLDEQLYYERIAYTRHLLNKDSKPSKLDVQYLKRYGMTVHEYNQSVKSGLLKGCDSLLRLALNGDYFKVHDGYKEIPHEIIEQSKARVIALPKSIETIDINVLSKFDIIIVPNQQKNKFSQLLKGYYGKVVDDSNERIWSSSEMTPSAYSALHGEYELKTENNKHYLQAKDGTCAYFVQELEDSYTKSMNLNLSWLKIREYFSLKDKKFHWGAYYLKKADLIYEN